MNANDLRHSISTAKGSLYHSIEEMQAAAKLAGWDVTYTQIEAGEMFSSYANAGDCDDIILTDTNVDRQIECVGTTPPGHVTLVAPCDATELWVNGHSLDKTGIILLRGGAKIHSFGRHPGRVLSMHIPTHLLTECDFTDGEGSTTDAIHYTKTLRPCPHLNDSLRLVMDATIYDERTVRQRWAQHASLTGHVQNCLRGEDAQYDGRYRLTAKSALQTIGNARAFIHANLYDAMAIGEIAVSAAASVSKLERVFRQHLGVTPSQYIRAHRLSAARSALQDKSHDRRKVAQIALDCGFNHLGRFSRLYRNQFGETPSATLAAR